MDFCYQLNFSLFIGQSCMNISNVNLMLAVLVISYNHQIQTALSVERARAVPLHVLLCMATQVTIQASSSSLLSVNPLLKHEKGYDTTSYQLLVDLADLCISMEVFAYPNPGRIFSVVNLMLGSQGDEQSSTPSACSCLDAYQLATTAVTSSLLSVNLPLKHDKGCRISFFLLLLISCSRTNLYKNLDHPLQPLRP